MGSLHFKRPDDRQKLQIKETKQAEDGKKTRKTYRGSLLFSVSNLITIRRNLKKKELRTPQHAVLRFIVFLVNRGRKDHAMREVAPQDKEDATYSSTNPELCQEK